MVLLTFVHMIRYVKKKGKYWLIMTFIVNPSYDYDPPKPLTLVTNQSSIAAIFTVKLKIAQDIHLIKSTAFR